VVAIAMSARIAVATKRIAVAAIDLM